MKGSTFLSAVLFAVLQPMAAVAQEIEYRWARGHYEELPALAAELVSIPVAVTR